MSYVEPKWVDAGELIVGRTTYKLFRNAAEPTDVGTTKVRVAYKLVGKRGAEYVLIRNLHDDSMLFPANAKRFTASTPFQWVRESDGTLEVVR